jgi:hypothetical protein
MNRSPTFHVPFTHLSGTFPMTENGVKRLKDRMLMADLSENGGKER